MDYKKKYKELLNTTIITDLSLLDKLNIQDDFDKCVVLLRLIGCTYKQIQLQLGNPSKDTIRTILLKYCPDYIDNSIKKENKYSEFYCELYNILSHTDKKIWEVFGDDVECYIDDHNIYYDGDLLNTYTSVEQAQILNEIKNQL